jgi:hypothetical protein
MFASDDDDHSNSAQHHCNFVDVANNKWNEPILADMHGNEPIYRGRGKLPMFIDDPNLKVIWDPDDDQMKPFLFGGDPGNRWYRTIIGIREVNTYAEDDESRQIALAHLRSAFVAPH